MNQLQEVEDKNYRRDILEILNADADSSANTAILQSAMRAVGSRIAGDRLKTQLQWLKEQGYVSLDDQYGITVATLTAAGQDIAEGLSSNPGIAKKRL